MSHFPSLPSVPLHVDGQPCSYLIPLPLLSDLLKYDLLHVKIPPSLVRPQFTIPPPATWSKCRVAAPKIWAHQGPIRSAGGTPCRTSSTLDLALRATRSFWQESPTPHHPSWHSLLSTYASQTSPFFPFYPSLL